MRSSEAGDRMIRLSNLLGKMRSHRLDHFSARRQNAQHRQRAGVNHCLSVYEDLEFAIAGSDHLHIGLQVATESCRHPGGVQPGNSISAITHDDSLH